MLFWRWFWSSCAGRRLLRWFWSSCARRRLLSWFLAGAKWLVVGKIKGLILRLRLRSKDKVLGAPWERPGSSISKNEPEQIKLDLSVHFFLH